MIVDLSKPQFVVMCDECGYECLSFGETPTKAEEVAIEGFDFEKRVGKHFCGQCHRRYAANKTKRIA